MCRLHYDGRDGRLDAVEQTSHPRDVAKRNVEPRQTNQHEQRWQHKQCTSRNAAARFVHQPTDVGGQLLRLGPWQHHAVVECVQKAFF